MSISDELISAGVDYFNRQRYAKAVLLFSEAISRELSASALSNRGAAYKELGEYDKAIEDLTAAIALIPQFVHAYHNRGNVYNALGRYDSAIADYSKAISINPNHYQPHFSRGNAHRLSDKPELAVSDYRSALALKPDYFDAWLFLGICQEQLDRQGEAIESFRRALSIEPGSADAVKRLAGCLEVTDRCSDALETYHQYLASAADVAEEDRQVIEREIERLRVRVLSPAKRIAKPTHDLSAVPYESLGVSKGVHLPNTPYCVGDVIGTHWHVLGVVGRGGMGVVYKVYAKFTKGVNALKSIRDDLLTLPQVRDSFRNEVELWIGLDRHPHILSATWVEDIGGRLFVQMDYLQPQDGCRGSALSYLLQNGPVDKDRALRWAVQCCWAMEHANRHGIVCHRDLKPGNILVDGNDNIRITDFGLAKAMDSMPPAASIDLEVDNESHLTIAACGGCGTTEYMPPEQFATAGGTVKNDIYSFGVILFEMLKGSRPFQMPVRPRERSAEAVAQYMKKCERIHRELPVPDLGGNIGHIIKTCMAKDAAQRYESFEQLREELIGAAESRTDSMIAGPAMQGKTPYWMNVRAVNLMHRERFQEALDVLEEALLASPEEGALWVNKGNCLDNLRRYEEALECYAEALKRQPVQHSLAWHNSGNTLWSMGKYDEALRCFANAIELNPSYAKAHISRGRLLAKRGETEAALRCYDRALAIDARNTGGLQHKGDLLRESGRQLEALQCYIAWRTVDPGCVLAWYHEGLCLREIGRPDEAIGALTRCVEIADESSADVRSLAARAIADLGGA